MGDFVSGFLTGFANTVATDITKRNDDARDYFNKQVETARTLGLENRRRSSAMIDESVSVAKRLQAMGVPKDIIMAQANMDPAGLGDFYAQVEKLRLEANVPVDEDFFRSVYKLSGTFQAPDEDFNTFFSKIYGPIVEAAKEDPEGFKQDPEGSIWARAFGGGAMDKARKKLATTEVVPGMTAEEAIAQGDTPRPNKVGGDSFVTVDPDVLKKTTGTPSSLSPNDMKSIREQFKEQADLFETELTNATDENGNAIYDSNKADSLGQLKIATNAAAYKALEEQFAGNEKYLAYIRSVYSLDEEGLPLGMEAPTAPTEAPTAPTEALTEPSPEEATTGAPEASAAVEAPPRPVTKPSAETTTTTEENPSVPNIQFVDGKGNPVTLVFVSNNMDGTATYRDASTGKLQTYPVSVFQELANR